MPPTLYAQPGNPEPIGDGANGSFLKASIFLSVTLGQNGAADLINVVVSPFFDNVDGHGQPHMGPYPALPAQDTVVYQDFKGRTTQQIINDWTNASGINASLGWTGTFGGITAKHASGGAPGLALHVGYDPHNNNALVVLGAFVVNAAYNV